MQFFARTIVRTARTFNGTTSETVDGYDPDPRTDFLRTYKYSTEAVGSWSSELLHNPDRKRSLALWVRLIGTPIAGDSRVELRSGKTGDPGVEATYEPTDLLLASHALTTTWSGPYQLGPTDRVGVVHEEEVAESATIEFRTMDLVEAAQLGLVRDLALPDSDACCATSSDTITTSSTVAPWTGTRYFFIEAAAGTSVSVTLPLLADIPLGRRAVFIRVGAGVCFLAPGAGDPMNGQVNEVIGFDGFGAVVVDRRETTWTATRNVLSNTQTLTNAVAGATVDLLAPDAEFVPVRLGWTEAGFLRLPLLADAVMGATYGLQRNGGTAQIIVIPRTGETLNGEVDGRAYLGTNDGSASVRATPYGWQVVGDGQVRAAPHLVLTIDATLALWGAGLLTATATQVAAQEVALPISTLPIAPGAMLAIGCAGAGGLTLNGNGYLIRSGTGAPAATMVLAQHENALLLFTGALWIAFLGT